LWRPDTKTWDAEKFITLFGQQSWDALSHTSIIAGTGPDILCWKLNSDGQCTSKSAYKMLAFEEARNSTPINIPVHVLQILRQVWADKTIHPRVKTFAWRLLRLALGTASRLHRIIPRINEDCSRCGCKEDETHLFFECSYARAVWFGSVIGLRPHALPSIGHGLHLQIATIL